MGSRFDNPSTADLQDRGIVNSANFDEININGLLDIKIQI
jgi:hypothetical protein